MQDTFRCFDAQTGQERWAVSRLAIAALDYGNSPRATPLLFGGNAYCLGATGNLLCIELQSGKVLWERALRDDFPLPKELPWGYCGSPLLINNQIVIAPGSPDASLVALDPWSGEVIWHTAGELPSYGSFTIARVGGHNLIVGHDHTTLGAWRADDGQRLWSVKPIADGDFNVPTPLVYNDTLIVATRNNGTRQFRFGSKAEEKPVEVAMNKRLRPDMTTPVIIGDRLYCVREFLYCLDLSNGLKELWRMRDPALSDYASLIASNDHLLVVADGELLLLPSHGSKKIVSRMKLFEQPQQLYSHPALVGNRLFLRGKSQLLCIELTTAP